MCLAVCEHLRRVGDGFATYAMTWRRFCDEFCRTKMCFMFKTLANRSRRVRDACDEFMVYQFGQKQRYRSNAIFLPLQRYFYRSNAIFTVRTLYFTVRTVKISVRTVKILLQR